MVDPLKLIEKRGAEILRMWVSNVDYSNDVQAGQESFDRCTESYRRVRNTCRYILGNLSDFDPAKDAVPYEKLLELDKWALASLANFLETCHQSYEKFEFHSIYQALQNYCTVDLSAIYLDILKDRLYTFKKSGLERRAAQTTIYNIVCTMVGVMAPVLSFLAEEVYQCLPGQREESVFLTDFPKVNAQWKNEDLYSKWAKLFEVRSSVTKKLEESRQNKLIGSGLEARVILGVPQEFRSLLNEKLNDLPSVFIVSQVELKEADSLSINVEKALGEKCERCWNYSPETGANKKFPAVCPKCVGALS